MGKFECFPMLVSSGRDWLVSKNGKVCYDHKPQFEYKLVEFKYLNLNCSLCALITLDNNKMTSSANVLNSSQFQTI